MTNPVTIERAESDSMHAQVLCLAIDWGAEDDVSCSTIPFLNRPFLHHVVERLAGRGVKHIRFVCEQSKEAYVKLLGTGERWGLSFEFTSVDAGQTAGIDDAASTSQRFLQPGFLSLASHSLPLSTKINPTQKMIRVDSPTEFIGSQIAVMRKQMSQYTTIERDLGGQVWVGRSVRIHRSAKIEGPVLIGDNTRVGPGVHLTPFSVIGPDCVIGRNTTISKSTVMEGLYVGESLQIHNSIVFAEKIRNVHFDATIQVNDPLLVSRVR